MKTHATVGACIIHENKTLLIHHHKSGLWLFPGGHIEEDETPDAAVKREAQEEVDLHIDLVKQQSKKADGETEVLALPFYANLHSVGDHYHFCFYYLCTLKQGDVHINHESRGFRWMAKEEISQDSSITPDVKKIAALAFEKYTRHS